MRAWIVVLLLALLPVGLWFARRPQPTPQPPAALVADGPAFEITVTKPRASRPLFGLLPDGLFGAPPAVLRFDHTSEGVDYRRIDASRLEIHADEWQLVLEVDERGQVGAGSHLVFPLELGAGRPTLDCSPEDDAFGELEAEIDDATGTLSGHFRLMLSTCVNTASGKVAQWPPSPLTVRGRLERLPLTVEATP